MSPPLPQAVPAPARALDQPEVGPTADGDSLTQRLERAARLGHRLTQAPTPVPAATARVTPGPSGPLVQRMRIGQINRELLRAGIEFMPFFNWLAEEFAIWQNLGAFDSTALGFNAEGDIVYPQTYRTCRDYLADPAFKARDLAGHIQDFQDKTGYVDDPTYARYLNFDRRLVPTEVALSDLTTFFPLEKKEINRFKRQRALAVEMWLNEEAKLAGAAKAEEVEKSAGKGNLGLFRIRAGKDRYFVKVIHQSSQEFTDQEALAERSEELSQIPDVPGFARILYWNWVGGVNMGLFEEAQGETLEDLHQSFAKGERTEREMTGIYASVGKGMGAFNLTGVDAKGPDSVKRGAPARMHTDANPSNLLVDRTDDNRTTLVDTAGVNLKARLDGFIAELASLLWDFKQATFEAGGMERLEEKTRARDFAPTPAEARMQSELRMFHAFASAYAGKAPDSIRRLVTAELTRILEQYLGWYASAAKVTREMARQWIPEFAQPIGS